MRHLLSIQDLSEDDIKWIIRKTAELKKNPKERNYMEKRVLALIFEKPSTRTRISMSVAMHNLGGAFIVLNPSDLQLGRGETAGDTARTLSGYVDFIAARVNSHRTLEELRDNSTIPVINLLSDMEHPCQALGDLFTIAEKFGKFRGVAFVGDGNNNVTHSLLLLCSKLGINISVGCPKEYEPNEKILEKARKNAKKYGSHVIVTNDPVTAVKEEDIIYTDTWVSMGRTDVKKRLELLQPYQVNERLAAHAKKDYAFMHCLPAHRGHEVTEGIMDGRHSIVWPQAENRLYSAMAILLFLSRK